MYVKIVSRVTKVGELEKSKERPKWQLDLPNTIIECDEVLWHRVTALSEADLQDVFATMMGVAPGTYEVLGAIPDNWYEKGEVFTFLKLITTVGAEVRPILIYEQSVYLMNDQGKTIERIC